MFRARYVYFYVDFIVSVSFIVECLVGLFDRILKLFPKFVECVPAGNTACTEMNHCIKRT